MKLQAVRGTKDLLPDEARRFRLISNMALQTAELFGFEEMSTPIFEFAEVFLKGLGETTDIVGKEMYSFEDRGGDLLSLRPEGTAGIVRAFISQGLSQNLPLKVFYRGPMFRYERPQKGRQRQFHQLGVELLGVESPQADSECIALAQLILQNLKIDSLCKLEVNSIGDEESRASYRKILVDYFSDYKKDLSPDSQTRLEKNPMRILDSKNPEDQEICQKAPVFAEHLSSEAVDFFTKVCVQLQSLNIPYEVNPRLVRGLDYYSHTVFEFKTQSLGAQDAVLSGGRYDRLVQMMGGPSTPGVGWAAGLERLALLFEQQQVLTKPRPITMVPMGPQAEMESLRIAQDLRQKAGLIVESTYSGNLQKRLKRAHKMNSLVAVILGEREIQEGLITLKNFDSGEQKQVPINKLVEELKSFALHQNKLTT